MGTVYNKTFTAASAALSTFMTFDLSGGDGPTGSESLGPQVLRVFARGAAGGTCAPVIQFVMAYPDGTAVGTGVIMAEKGTLDADASSHGVARRTNFANDGGGHVYTVRFERSGNDTLDLLGVGARRTTDGSATAAKLTGYLGVTNLDSESSLTLEVILSQAGAGG